MSEPHTHGGTDAPECTTCRSTQRETDRLATLISDLRVGHRSEEIADAILASDWLAERDARIRRQALDEAVKAIEALGSALDRTEANFRAAVAGYPVRGMTENLDENAAARIAAANLRDGGEQRCIATHKEKER